MKLTILIDGNTVLDKEIEGGKVWGNRSDNCYGIGLLGELAIQNKLSELGITSIKLPNSSPADFFLINNKKLLEVKTARKGYTKAKGKQFENYAFNVKHKISDYIIVWLVDSNKFYVLSSKDIKVGVNRVYPYATKWKTAEENWKILT